MRRTGTGGSGVLQKQHGGIVWLVLFVSDREKAKSHYGPLMGRTFSEPPLAGGTCHLTLKDGRRIGGIPDLALIPVPSVPPHWMTDLTLRDAVAV